MSPAARPRPAVELRMLVLDARSPARVVTAAALARELARGDVVVVNDAATIPASLSGRTRSGAACELRLVASHGTAPRRGALAFDAVVFGDGDHRTATEQRPPPPLLREGDVVEVGSRREGAASLLAEVRGISTISPRLVTTHLTLGGEPGAPDASIWSAIYREGHPVQYAYVPEPLALWDVQNVYAAEPWALEMPSAGRVVSAEVARELEARGVVLVALTHAAGPSSTGDPRIDARLPLPERFRVPRATSEAIARARASDGKVVAVGTSVVRALEAASAAITRGEAASGVTDLVLGPHAEPRIADAIVTGVHERGTSHFELLRAFASDERLEDALRASERAGLLGHEFGDVWLVIRGRLRAL